MINLAQKTEIDTKKLKERYGTEEVFVLPYNLTEDIPNLFTSAKIAENRGLSVDVEKGKYILRCDAEKDITFQQIIPCAMIMDSDHNFFITKRIAGEPRLKDRLSLTVGGHINPVDGFNDPINKCLDRELKEEMTLPQYPFYNKRLYGFVRDLGSSTPDHIGVVYLIQISNCHRDKIEVKETNSLDGQWITKRDLVDHYDDFESWARLLISDIVVSIREKGAGTFKWKE